MGVALGGRNSGAGGDARGPGTADISKHQGPEGDIVVQASSLQELWCGRGRRVDRLHRGGRNSGAGGDARSPGARDIAI